MSKIYGSPLFLSGSGGMNKDLPPLLDNFKAKTTKLYIGEGNTISKLPSGSKVKLGSYNGQSLRWIVARDSVTQDLRLVLDKDSVTVIGTMQYDAPEPSNPDSGRKSSGNNKYSVSNIHQWLNSDGAANEWYTAQHEYDAPPDYQNKTGFLNEWPEVDKSILKETDWSTILATIDGGETETINAKMALMSETELGLEEDTGGNKLDIFNADADRATGSYYLTRTPNPVTSIYAWQVTPSGSNTLNTVKSAYGVRPICAPNPNTIVSETTDEDGCYTIGADGVELSADKILESRANELAGAVWVYGDHEPESVNDGTKIQLSREEIVDSGSTGTESQTVSKTIQWNNEANFFARQFTYNSKKQYQTMLEGAIATITLVGVPEPVSDLAETHSGSSITLTWKNPTSDELYNHTVVVYKTDAFPTTIDDGTQGYSGTDETATLSDLELGTT